MPSPDVAAYTGLTLSDVTAQDLIDTALANIVEKFPDWEPREGNTEVVLLEQLASIVEEDVYAINALVDGITEALLRLFGLTRDPGAPPTASVTFTVADTDGHTIPAGTTVRLDLGTTADPLDLITDVDLVIPAGQTTGTVTVAGTEPAVTGNGKPAGTALELLDAISSVDAVTLATVVGGGRLPEDGDAFLNRGTPLLSRLTNTLVRPQDVAAYVIESGIARVNVLDLYNPSDPASFPGGSPGYVTVAVTAAGGASIGATARATLAANLRNRMLAGLVINVVDADVSTVDVTITVRRYAATDAATTEANVRQALISYLNADTWSWGGTVYLNELIAHADAAAGVDVVGVVTAGINGGPQAAADLQLPGYAPLVVAGTITITVEDPSA